MRPVDFIIIILYVAQGIRRPGYAADDWTEEWARQKFVDFTVPQAQFLGLTLPDPLLRWNESV